MGMGARRRSTGPILLVPLFIILLHLPAHALWFMSEPVGVLTSTEGHNLFYVGENVTLMCTKSSSVQGFLFFQRGSEDISQDYVTQFHNNSALLQIPVTPDNEWKQATYACCEDNGSLTSVATLADLYTDYAPQRATDLEVVWLNWKTVFLHWGFNHTRYKNNHTEFVYNITAEWSADLSNDANWKVCYVGKINNSSCSFDERNEFANLSVRVNFTAGRNIKRSDFVSTSQIFPAFRVKDYVKHLPVESVVVKALNSTAVELSFELPNEGPRHKLIYSIRYFTQDGADDRTTLIERKTSLGMVFEIIDLHPDYLYTFEVRCRDNPDTGYFSDLPLDSPSLRMPEDAPSSAPVILAGSFYRVGCDLYIYYQDIPDAEKNGQIQNYTASLQGQMFEQRLQTRTLKAVLSNCSHEEVQEVTVRAHTSVGASPPTHLVIPASTGSAQSLADSAQSLADSLGLRLKVGGSGQVTAQWNRSSPAFSSPPALYLYYCRQNDNDSHMCESAIQRVRLDSGGEEGQGLELPGATPGIKFGLAAVAGDNTSQGIYFTQCIYNPDKVVGGSLQVQAVARQESVVVTWSGMKECDQSSQVIVLGYKISVIDLRSQHTETYTVGPRDISLEVEKVEGGVSYNIQVEAMTTSGMTSSSVRKVTLPVPTATGLTLGEKMAIVSTVLVLVIVVAVVLLCKCRKIFQRKKKRHFSERLTALPLPVPNKNHPAQDSIEERNHNQGIINSVFSISLPKDVSHGQVVSGEDSGYSANSSPLSSLTDQKPVQVQVQARPDGYYQVTAPYDGSEGDNTSSNVGEPSLGRAAFPAASTLTVNVLHGAATYPAPINIPVPQCFMDGDESGPSQGEELGSSQGEEHGPLQGKESAPSQEASRLTPGYFFCSYEDRQGEDPGPSQGEQLGPSQGEELGLSQGEQLGPAHGDELGPSQGIELGPSQGIELGPSQGVELGPSLGEELREKLGSLHGKESGPSQEEQLEASQQESRLFTGYMPQVPAVEPLPEHHMPQAKVDTGNVAHPQPSPQDKEMKPQAEERERGEPKAEEREREEPKPDEGEREELEAKEREREEPKAEEGEREEPKAEEGEREEPKAEEGEREELKAEGGEREELKAEGGEREELKAEEGEREDPKAEEGERQGPEDTSSLEDSARGSSGSADLSTVEDDTREAAGRFNGTDALVIDPDWAATQEGEGEGRAGPIRPPYVRLDSGFCSPEAWDGPNSQPVWQPPAQPAFHLSDCRGDKPSAMQTGYVSVPPPSSENEALSSCQGDEDVAVEETGRVEARRDVAPQGGSMGGTLVLASGYVTR